MKTRSAAWKITLLLLIYLSLAAAANITWRILHLPPQMQHGVLNPGLMLLSGAILLGSILIATSLVLRWFENRPLGSAGLPFSGPWLTEMVIGGLFGSLTPVIFFLVASKMGVVLVTRVTLSYSDILIQTLPALGSMMLLAYHEELVFRGYLMQVISQKGGRMLAALVTGMLFGLLHAANSAANPQGLVFTMIGGVLLAWLVMRNGSLWMAGGYHAAWNITASLGLGLSVSGTTTPGSWIATTLSGARWVTGGTYGFESSVITGLTEPIILGLLVWAAPRLPSHPELRRYFERPRA